MQPGYYWFAWGWLTREFCDHCTDNALLKTVHI